MQLLTVLGVAATEEKVGEGELMQKFCINLRPLGVNGFGASRSACPSSGDTERFPLLEGVWSKSPLIGVDGNDAIGENIGAVGGMRGNSSSPSLGEVSVLNLPSIVFCFFIGEVHAQEPESANDVNTGGENSSGAAIPFTDGCMSKSGLIAVPY